MVTTDPLVFLRATLDAAEEAANKAAALCGCHPPAPSWAFGDESTDGRILVVGDPHPGTRRRLHRRWNGSYGDMFAANHIVLHDPAAVLRRIAADRKKIAEHPVVTGWDGSSHNGRVCATCAQDAHDGGLSGDPYPCTTLRLVAEGWGWTEGGDE